MHCISDLGLDTHPFHLLISGSLTILPAPETTVSASANLCG